jgi:hypothetical protein
MTRFERRWLLAILDAILPPRGDPRLPPALAEAPFDRFADDLWDRSPPDARLGIRAAVWAATWLPALRRLRPLHRLPPAERPIALARLAESRSYAVRELIGLLKVLACLAVGGLPEAQRAMGLPRPDPEPPAWARAPSDP